MPASDIALEDMFVRYHHALLRFLHRRVSNPADADDLAQEVYVRLSRKEDVGQLQYPQAYLFQTAANVLRDTARGDRVRKRQSHIAYDEQLAVDSAPAHDRAVEIEQAYARFETALNGLGERCRHVFVLHRFEGMTYTEIARHFGCSVSAIEKHMMKAILHFDRFEESLE